MPDQPSGASAIRVATQRAAHQIVDAEPRILDDPIVARLLDQSAIERIHESAAALRAPEFREFRSRIVTRSRYAEDRLAEAIRRGVGQYVILGAGLDTFAWRQPPWAEELAIFEVDLEASQLTKRESLASARLESPPNLKFVAIDFERESIRDSLQRSGFDFGAPAFFSWLGVMMYLTEEASDSIFRFVGSLPRSTELVFTFASPDAFSMMAKAGVVPGERIQAHSEVDSLSRKLKAAGFSSSFFPSSEELTERYFRGRADLEAPKSPGVGCTVV